MNLLLIILWIMVPIYALAEPALEGGFVGIPYAPGQVLVNGLLAGSFFVLGFYRGQRAVLARFPRLSIGTKSGPGSH